MARRRIGQEDLIARPEARAASSLAALAALLDWGEIDRALVDISAAVRGELGWPPLALFRALRRAGPGTGAASPPTATTRMWRPTKAPV
jgi:hypothetical protein